MSTVGVVLVVVAVSLAIVVPGTFALRRKRWVDRRTLSPFERVPPGGDEPPRTFAGSTIVGMMSYSAGTWLAVGSDELCISGLLMKAPLVARRRDVGRIIVRTRLGRRRVEFRDRDDHDSFVVFLTFDAELERRLSSLAWPVEDAPAPSSERRLR